MRFLAVIPVATCVLRTEFLQILQERDETFCAFSARAQSKAETCEYKTSCEDGKSVDYTDNIIRDVLLTVYMSQRYDAKFFGYPASWRSQ